MEDVLRVWLRTGLQTFVDAVHCEFGGGVGARGRMDDGAGGGGDGDDCSCCAAKVLEEIVDHEMGAFDVGFLQCYV